MPRTPAPIRPSFAHLRSIAAAFALAGAASVAPAAHADEPGLASARQELAAHPPSDDTEVVFLTQAGTKRVLRPCKRPCSVRWVMAAAAVPRSAIDAAATNASSATPPAAMSGSTPATAGATPAVSGATAGSAATPEAEPAAGAAQRSPSPPASAADYDALVRAPPMTPFTPQGATQGRDAMSIADDAVQVLGQIVVDRASAAAIELVRAKIVEGLGCGGATRFPRTCAVLGSLRLQDIAQGRRALFDAVLADATRIALDRANALGVSPPGAPRSDGARRAGGPLRTSRVTTTAAIAPTAATTAKAATATIDGAPLRVLVSLLVPDIVRVLDGRSARSPNVAAQRLVDGTLASIDARAGATAPTRWIHDSLPRGRQAIAVAALAFAACESEAARPSGYELAKCPIQDFARGAAAAVEIADDAVLTRSQELALELLDAATLRAGEGGAWRERMARAVDATFTASCLSVDTTPTLDGCPASLEAPPGAKPPIPALSVARYIVTAGVDGDASSVIAGASAAVAMADGGDDPSRKRALRLVAALLEYAATTTEKPASAADASQASRKRTKLLDDLTSEMTDRTSRDGDAIWSLGGSLRAAGGARVGTSTRDVAVYGPIALPLGVGFQNIPRGDTGFLGRVGWHLELSVVDLGQYISYQEGGKVRTPEVADALAPSAMLGLSWGRSFPVIFGVTGGYAPQYQFHPNDTSRGALQIGAALGVYVPLLDIN